MPLGADTIAQKPFYNNKVDYNDNFYISTDEISNAITQYDDDLYQLSINNKSAVNSITSFINDSSNELVGEVWDKVRKNLNDYESYLNEADELSKEISETQKKCLKILQDFLPPDNSLNIADLPSYENEKILIEDEIERLKSENERLSSNQSYQNQIALNINRIETELIPALTEVNRKIDKINYLKEVILPQIKTEIEALLGKVNNFSSQIEDIKTSSPSSIARVGATAFVGLTSAISGVANEIENIVDGVEWVRTNITTGIVGLASSAFDALGADELANAIDDVNDKMKRSAAEWIAIDHVGNWNRAFYEGIGSSINNASNMAYDSKEAQMIQDIATKGTEIVFEGAATLATGNTALATAIGSLTEAGKEAEKIYSNSDAPSLADNREKILLHGLVGAANGNATGGLMASLKAAARVAAEMGIESGAKEIFINSVKNSFTKEFAGNAFQVAGNMSERALDGKENNALTLGADILTEFGLNIYTGGISSGSKASAQFLGNIFEKLDNISDSGIIDSLGEIAGVDLSDIRFIGGITLSDIRFIG